jgi:hypothetical protein
LHRGEASLDHPGHDTVGAGGDKAGDHGTIPQTSEVTAVTCTWNSISPGISTA